MSHGVPHIDVYVSMCMNVAFAIHLKRVLGEWVRLSSHNKVLFLSHCLGCLYYFPSFILSLSIVFTQDILSEMEDDRLDVSQSDDVIPTQERMVRDSIIKSVHCKGLLHGLDATELHIINDTHGAWGTPYCPRNFVYVYVCVREAGRYFYFFHSCSVGR